MKKGSMLLIAFAIVALCLPVGVSAAPIDDWNISGSVQFETFRYKYDDKFKEDSGFYTTTYKTTDPYNRTQWDLNTLISRLNFSATSGDLTGVVEIRPNIDNYLRLFYAKWNFGIGSLLIGQNWTCLNQFYSNQVAEDWNSMLGYGATWELRKPMIQVQIAGLKVQLLKPNTSASIYDRSKFANVNATPSTLSDVHADYPKVEAAYTQGFGPIVIDVAGGYNTYILRTTTTDKDIRINSYLAQGGVTANLGPLKATLSGYWGKNTGIIGIGEYWGYSNPEIDSDGKSLIDAKSYGYMAVVSYVVIPIVTVEAGYGKASTVIDDGTSGADDWYDKWTVGSYYLQAKIALSKGVYVIPEAGVIDYGKWNHGFGGKGTKQGNKKYIGAQWQMDF